MANLLTNDLEEIKNCADEAKRRIESVVACIQRLIDERDVRQAEEIIYPSAEIIGAEVDR